MAGLVAGDIPAPAGADREFFENTWPLDQAFLCRSGASAIN